MWSVGALLELDDRAKMEEFARTNFELDLPPIAEGSQDTIFEFLVSEGGNWFIPNSDFTSRRSWRGFSVPYYLNTCFPIETNEPTEQNKQTNKKTRNKQNQNDDLRLSWYYRRSECVVVVRYCLSLKWVNVSFHHGIHFNRMPHKMQNTRGGVEVLSIGHTYSFETFLKIFPRWVGTLEYTSGGVHLSKGS